MPIRLNIRFQHWALGSVLALVSVLSAVVLLTVFQTFRQMAEEGATARFALIAGKAWGELDGLIGHSARFTAAQAEAELALFIHDGQLNAQDMVSTFIGSLAASPETYSHFFGLANEDFLQVVGVRGNSRIAAALGAPDNTHFAIRRIIAASDGNRREAWQFLDARRQPIASLDGDARFLPSTRPWYADARAHDGLVVTAPYVFASSGEPGITVAHALRANAGVIATDISLDSLQRFVATLPLSDNGAIAVVDGERRLLAFHGRGERYRGFTPAQLTAVEHLDNPYLRAVSVADPAADSAILSVGGGDAEKFVLTRFDSAPLGGRHFTVVVFSPLDDFLGPFAEAKNNVVLVTIVLLLVLVPLSWIGSRQVVRTLSDLAADSEHMKQLDFSHKPTPPHTFLYEVNTLGDAQCVMHDAIEQRTAELALAQHKLASLVDNGIRLGREQDREALFQHILAGAKDIAHCAAATLFLKSERDTLVFAQRTESDPLPHTELPLYDEAGNPNEHYVATYAVLHGETVIIDDVDRETRFNLTGTRSFSSASGLHAVSMLTVPLSPRAGEVIGAIQLINAHDPKSGETVAFAPDIVGFVQALAAQSAVALENRQLLEAQKQLMDAFIELIAGAIDAKSAYTGGHCERVPELAIMLAHAAEAADSGSLADFRFRNDDERREFRIGAWLHDCGKVTTPEYVVDKATKLETLYNRIHEIRTRFEILLRDAEIERLLAIHQRGEPAAIADARFAARKTALEDDFAFVAEANIGGEFMAAADIARIHGIARQHWLRHFDDRLGLSQDEQRRRGDDTEPTLPARETLLADQPWHIVAREPGARIYDPALGWKMDIPERQYHFGEVYNLCIERGTLTAEERFKINEHIMQTIRMLEQLPLPPQLRRVPEYAGTHHETMTGNGYPRGLSAEQLSIPSRIMAVADIFEALTASDRPYKPTKTLSESIAILARFRDDGHIDPDVFELLLSSGVYLSYAERFLKKEQIDEVDAARYLREHPRTN